MSFYGQEIFHPRLFTEEQARAALGLMPQGLWPFVMDIARTLRAVDNTPVYVYEVGSVSKAVFLGNPAGQPVVSLRHGSDGYSIVNWYHELKKRGGTKRQLQSKNRAYLVKNFQPHAKIILREAAKAPLGRMNTAAYTFVRDLDNETGNAGKERSTPVENDTLYTLLRIATEPDFRMIDVPTPTLTAINDYYLQLKAQHNNKKSYQQRVNDMLGDEKVVLGVHTYYERKFVSVSVVKFKLPLDPYAPGAECVVAPSIYSNLDDAIDLSPYGNSIKSSLTFLKVDAEQNGQRCTTHHNDSRLIAGDRVHEDIGVIGFSTGPGATFLNPYWYILPKTE